MEADRRPKKRARVSVACRQCRDRKTRCNGNHPSCKRCEQLAIPCEYDQPTGGGIARRSDTSGLLSRVKELESQLKSFARSPHASRRASTSADGALDEDSICLENNDRRNSTTLYSPTSNPEGGAAHHPVNTDGVDGMGIITLSDNATFSSYFGPSSNVALVYELTRVLKTLSGAPVNLVNPRAEGVEASNNQQNSLPSSYSLIPRDITVAGAQYLPPEPEATSLLHEYFDTIGLFFPCIYRDTFLAKYRDFRRNDSSHASRSWRALLFVMFAVMYQMRSFASPTDAEDKLSWEYFQRALNLAMPEAVINSDLETVQLLCLLTCYLQCSTNSAQTWSFHVLSVKAAMQIGLHSLETTQNLPLLQRELCKRTWFWCVVNDTLVSVYLGRPPVVPKSLISKNLPEDMSDIFPTSNQSRTVAMTSLAYYNAKIRLAMIISDILAQLYGDNMAVNNSMGVFETLRPAFDLSWKLSEWRSSVPAEIRPASVIAAPEIPRALQMQRFQTGLSSYFHAAQALIYRPVLLRFLQYKPDGTNATETLSLLKDSGFSTIKKCMHTCSRGVALAKIIVDEQFLQTSLWGAWWMTNFLVFNASMMHFGMLLISTQSYFSGLMATEDIDLILSDLKDASEVHRRLNRNNLIISRCRECLHNFLDLYKSSRDTTSPNAIGTWEDLTLSLQQPDFGNAHGSQTATSSILPNLEQNLVWFDMEAFPGPMA
ncbi:hypothetical protein ACMYSQ_009027 [Aspergillus niger]